ncbi:non-ribosomal peptide synthetase [Pseudophaeobacter arcticus]|uniref:non-ribosomal peptide synthetase n=1 Tax=Pseudophaeobacter arcticus TaxID=385492 RepID=UPI0024910E62|nr:amino acid adenylation domain-containing protein [Pseudophaeobacter arcticus]
MQTPQDLEAYPLTAMQAGMLFQSLCAADKDLYVEQYSCPLRGALDLAAFEQAWRQVMTRHAPLRTGFAWDGLPQPAQLVVPRVKVPLRHVDLSQLPPERHDAALQQEKQAERQAGFDLSHAPMMRLVLVALPAGEHHLIWSWHHAILDAWSGPIVLDEVLHCYEALIKGREIALPQVRPFKDFIAWTLQQDKAAAQSYWQQLLTGLDNPAPVDLGAAMPVKANAPNYGLRFLDLDAGEMDRLRQAAAHHGVTLNSFVQLAWAVLLGRYTGQHDVVFGTATSGRPAALRGVETMVGLFINTLPVRVALAAETDLTAALRALQTQLLRSRQHEHMPLAEIQQLTGLPADQTLLHSLLVFEDFGENTYRTQAGGISLGAAEFTERANFPVTLLFSVRESQQIGIGFDRSRFDAAMAARILTQFQQVMRSMADLTTGQLGQIDPLSSSERELLTQTWVRDQAWAPHADLELSVARGFAQQVQRSPDDIAAVFWTADGDQRLSYRALDQRCNQMARRLIGLGLRTGDRVVICQEPGLHRLVALLATLKAGGTYVPLDPSLPPALIGELIADAQAALVLVDASTMDGLPDMTQAAPRAEVYLCQEDGADCRDLPDGPLATLPQGADAAYMIYTSGSTGRRKGVVIEHGALAQMIAAQSKAFQIAKGARVLQFAAFSFDASVSEIFTALLSGATLYMAPRRQLLPSQEFLSLLARWRISTVTLPPTVLSRLPHCDLPDLRVLVTAGEPCPAELVKVWAPGRVFLNAYGPTECTVCATLGQVTPDGRKPSIGRALGRVETYILDSDMRVCPIGVTGELYLGGPQLARGYWQRAAQTKAAFVPHPFDATPGARLYRSGDMVRRLEDGQIDYLGRRDQQLKLRGYRVEPGEVEAALCHSPEVAEAAVLAVGEGAAKQLTAFVAPKPGAEWWPSISEFLVYDDLAYYAMTSDERRNDSYRAAIAHHVPGKVVVDIGTGPEALLARFCIEAGARHVYAIELLEETYLKAQARLRQFGLQDRITLIHGDATKVTLPEPADVSVSEIVGAIGNAEGAASIINGTRHLLRPGAQVIPERSRTLFAPVQLPDSLRANLGFGPLARRYVERIFDANGGPFDLRLSVRGLGYDDLLAEPQSFEDFDYRDQVQPEYKGEARFDIARAGRCDGFLVWLTLDCGGGPVLDILHHEHCWLPVFLPLDARGRQMAVGDQIDASFGAVLSDDGLHTDYRISGQSIAAQQVQGFDIQARHHDRGYCSSAFHADFFAKGPLPLAKPVGLNPEALRSQVQRQLPDYMVPQQIVEIDHLPLNSSGKVDHQALRQKLKKARPDADLDPDSGPVKATAVLDGFDSQEAQVAAIWREVLNQEVTLQGSFFEQGGHSLLLLDLQSRLSAAAGRQVALTDLFKFPTISGQARHLLSATPELSGTSEAAASADHTRAAERKTGRGRMAARRRSLV